jgi:hypothetical protein
MENPYNGRGKQETVKGGKNMKRSARHSVLRNNNRIPPIGVTLLGDPRLSNIYTQYQERPSLLTEFRRSWTKPAARRESEPKSTAILSRFIQKMLPPSLLM